MVVKLKLGEIVIWADQNGEFSKYILFMIWDEEYVVLDEFGDRLLLVRRVDVIQLVTLRKGNLDAEA